MTAKGWDVIQPSAPFKIGDLVKVINGAHRSFAIVVSDYYETESGLRVDVVDVVIGEKTHQVSPYYLERVNND